MVFHSCQIPIPPSPSKWFMDFVKEYRTRHPEDDAFSEFADFSQVPLGQKVGILHDLCEWRTENSEVFRKVVGSGEEDSELDWVWLFYFFGLPFGVGRSRFRISWISQRVDPIGSDANGNKYWLFDGLWPLHLHSA